MPFFTSSQESKLWLWTFIVFVSIFSTLFIGQPLVQLLSNQNIQAIIFLFGMLLVGAVIVVHGLKVRPSKIEITIWIGIIAVYVLFFLRLGLAERSHLIEYSVLAIFIHKALIERAKQVRLIAKPALLAFVFTFLIGVLDEAIQIMLPNRVFDLEDILFNGIAAAMAIGFSLILTWIRKQVRKA